MVSNMIANIRRLLSANKWLYNAASNIYHKVVFLFEKIYYGVGGVKVYNPKLYKSKKSHSQFAQDVIIDKYFLGHKKGFFVEVGANRPDLNSNSYYFEKIKDYSGISIDVIDYTKEYSEIRPKTKFIQALIGGENKEVEFIMVKNKRGWENQLSSISDYYKDEGKDIDYDIIKLNMMRLDEIVDFNDKIPDLFLLDVEGAEKEILKSINFKRWRPKILLIENIGKIKKQKELRAIMQVNGYRLRARIWTSDDIYERNEK